MYNDPYPINLMREMHNEIGPIDLPDDIYASIDYVLGILDPIARDIILYRYAEGMSYEAIAEAMSLSVDHVERVSFNARASIKEDRDLASFVRRGIRATIIAKVSKADEDFDDCVRLLPKLKRDRPEARNTRIDHMELDNRTIGLLCRRSGIKDSDGLAQCFRDGSIKKFIGLGPVTEGRILEALLALGYSEDELHTSAKTKVD